MTGKKIIIFDFDGTIADTLPAIIKVGNELASKYGYRQIAPDEVADLRNKSIKEIIDLFHIPFYKLPFLLQEARKKLNKHLTSITLFPGMKELITALGKKGAQLGILTSNLEDNVRFFLENNDLHCFDFIHTELNIFGKSKALDHLIAKHHLLKTEVVYVGDEVRDINACKKSDIDIIAVTWGFNTKELLKKNNPRYLTSTPEELFRLLSE